MTRSPASPTTSGPAGEERCTASFLLRKPGQAKGFRQELLPEGSGSGAAAGSASALTMVWIPPGRFWMGSPADEPERDPNEGPQHLVQLPGFFMSQTPITQAQWRLVAGWQAQPGEEWGRELNSSPSRFDGANQTIQETSNTDLHPVERVSWLDAVEFCQRLNLRTGLHYILPSEAQWEYACRAGTVSPFAFGQSIATNLANYDGNSVYAGGPRGKSRQQTTPVGTFPANAWGLHDMHGNVFEWCQDHWHESYVGAPVDGSVWLDQSDSRSGESDTKERLLRGGSWHISPKRCRSAFRLRGQPANVFDDVGFRVVCFSLGACCA